MANIIEARTEPNRNPVIRQSHRAQVILPQGFEYHLAEYATSTTKATGHIPLDWSSGYAHLAMLNMGPKGPKH